MSFRFAPTLADASESSNLFSANGEGAQHNNQDEARATDASTANPRDVLRSHERGTTFVVYRNEISASELRVCDDPANRDASAGKNGFPRHLHLARRAQPILIDVGTGHTVIEPRESGGGTVMFLRFCCLSLLIGIPNAAVSAETAAEPHSVPDVIRLAESEPISELHSENTSPALPHRERVASDIPHTTEWAPLTNPPTPRRSSRSASRTADRVRAMADFGAQVRLPVPRLVPCSQPPYFEDSNLERTGRSAGAVVQPLLSGVHFFGSVGVWPVKMARACPGSLVCPQEERFQLPVSRVRNFLSPAPGFGRDE